MVKKESGCSFRCNRCVHQNKVYPLGDRIHNGHDGVVTPQVNFPWKITFDMLYTNEFLLGVCSRALAIPSERTTI